MGSQLKAKNVQQLKVFLFDLCLTTLFYVFLPFSFFACLFFCYYLFSISFTLSCYLYEFFAAKPRYLELPWEIEITLSYKGFEQKDQKHLIKEVLCLYKFHWKICSNVRV